MEIPKNGTQILCRDEQFDNGDWPLIKALLKMFLYFIVPFAAMIAGEILISKSVGGRIEPGSWQAWASMLIVVAGSIVIVLAIVFWGKYNAYGNRFIYFIIHEENGLSVAGLNNGKLCGYVESEAMALEKIKAMPSPLYLLLYILCSKRRWMARKLARMQGYFLVNQKHHFIEKLLLGPNYSQYSDKIFSVSRIKYFSKGCEVFYTVMANGVQEERRQYIYRETTNYDILLAKLKELCKESNKESRTGWELSDEQVKQIRKNICRRLAILFVLAVVIVIVAYFGIQRYYESSAKAEMLQQAGEAVLSYGQSVLASRGRRRAYKGVIFVVVVMGAALIKLLSDAIRVHMFTCVRAEVVNYFQKSGSWYRRCTSDYPYYATVRYNNMTVTVGLSKEMWEKREEVRPLLVLKKGTPYCLIY